MTFIYSSGSSSPRTTSFMGVLNWVSSHTVGNFTLYVCILTLSSTFACSTVVHTGRYTTSLKSSHISVVVYVIGWAVADVLETSATTPNDAAYIVQDLDASLRTSAIFRYTSPFFSQCCETVRDMGCDVRFVNTMPRDYAFTAMQLRSPFFWDMRRVTGWLMPDIRESVVSSSRVACPLKMRPLRCLETSGTKVKWWGAISKKEDLSSIGTYIIRPMTAQY
jgi:hypothetical protein